MNGLSGFRTLVAHKPDCFCREDSAPFVVLDSEKLYEWGKNKRGVGHGSYAWVRFRCNDPDCPAIKIVRMDVLSEFVSNG